MTKKLIWRLKESPTPESLRDLVKDKILTHEEAREILLSSETKEDRDKKSLESEIKFLRELIEKLSNRDRIVEVIKEVQVPYRRYEWHNPYITWCDSSLTLAVSTNTFTAGDTGTQKFSSIKTF